jgi:hypothetical protein
MEQLVARRSNLAPEDRRQARVTEPIGYSPDDAGSGILRVVETVD